MDPTAAFIEGFLSNLKENFDPERVLSFGSRARKDELKGSGFDILVVSRKFERVHFLERMSMLTNQRTNKPVNQGTNEPTNQGTSR